MNAKVTTQKPKNFWISRWQLAPATVLWVVFSVYPLAARSLTLAYADSLLNAGEYMPAAQAYAQLGGGHPTPAILFRQAYAFEQAGRIPDALWTLHRSYQIQPEISILRKMDNLAAAHHLTGYEYGDRYWFFTLLHRHYRRLLEIILMIGTAAATVLVVRRRRLPNARPLGGILVGFVVAVASAVNLLRPEKIGREVIVRQPTPLMSEPAAGAQWLATLPAGQQLPVMGSADDIWLPVRWQGMRAWVRRTALYATPPE